MDRFMLNTQEVVLVIVDIQEKLAAVMSERQKVGPPCANVQLHLPVVTDANFDGVACGQAILLL